MQWVDGVGIPGPEDLEGDCIHHYKNCECGIHDVCFGEHLCDDFQSRTREAI